MMQFVDVLPKICYCPLKGNRQVDELAGCNHEWSHGQVIKGKGLPKGYQVKLFRIAVSTRRTFWGVINDLARKNW